MSHKTHTCNPRTQSINSCIVDGQRHKRLYIFTCIYLYYLLKHKSKVFMYIMLNLNLKLGIGCSVTCNCACMPLRPFEVSEGSLFGSMNHITYSVLSNNKKNPFICIKCLSWGKSIFASNIYKKKRCSGSDFIRYYFMTITYPYALDRWKNRR